jgi:N-acyl-D-amino-acid deacylase
MTYDIVIKNGYIIDGTGNPWFKADIGIKDEKIKKLSPLPLKNSGRVIDAKGHIVCPGFINLHSHSDSTILAHNKAENCLAMGLTTELTGNCGTSVAPITEAYRKFIIERMKGRSFSLMDEEVDWLTLDEWNKKLENKGIGINVAPLVGHGTLRSCVMGVEGEGGERIVPTEDEMRKMKEMLDNAMKDGAFGLSTGLIYAPGRNALTGEIIELVKVVAKYGGVYSSHIRDEGNLLIKSTQEAIEICEKTGVRGTIAHHKAMGRENYGKPSETIRMVERARARGVNMVIDQYPYQHGGVTKSLGTRFKGSDPSEELMVKTRMELVQKLKDPNESQKLLSAAMTRSEKEKELYKTRKKNLEEKGGWATEPFSTTSGTVIYSKSHSKMEGKSFEEVAVTYGEKDVIEALRKLLIEDEGWTCSGGEPYSEDDIVTILSYPWTTVSTDQYAMDNSKVSLQDMADALAMQHPRGWGTYAKILGKYVRDEKVITLEEAIRKMTSLPAGFLRLQDRGIIREGFHADLVVFDPKTVNSKATYGNPCLFPEGIPYVLVNGKVVIEQSQPTGFLAGKVLRYNN